MWPLCKRRLAVLPPARRALALLILAMWSSIASAQGVQPVEVSVPTPATPASSEQPPPPEAPRAVRLTWDERPSLRLWNEAVRIDLRARVQVDVASANHASNTVDEVDLRQHRIGVSGSVKGFVEFQVEKEVRSVKGWRDVFADVRLASPLWVQGGQFKMPFSMDQLTSSSNLDFVTRSLAARWLSPARDVGVMVHGRGYPFGGPRLGYEFGFFRHGGENALLGPETLVEPGAADSVDRRTIAGRLQVTPFDRPKKGGGKSKQAGPLRSLRLGVAATTGMVPQGDNGLRGQDSFSKTFFPRIDVSGRRLRIGTEFYWRPGPASIRAELIQLRDERRGQGISGEDLPAVVATGWYVQGAWTLLRGGKKAQGAGRWLGRGGIGDVELAARLERLEYGSADSNGEPPILSPRATNVANAWDTAVTFGVNWQPTPLGRIQFNVIRDQVGGAAWTKRHDQPLVWGVISRFQVAF